MYRLHVMSHSLTQLVHVHRTREPAYTTGSPAVHLNSMGGLWCGFACKLASPRLPSTLPVSGFSYDPMVARCQELYFV